MTLRRYVTLLVVGATLAITGLVLQLIDHEWGVVLDLVGVSLLVTPIVVVALCGTRPRRR